MTSSSPGGASGGTPNNSESQPLPRALLDTKGLPFARGTRLPSLLNPRDMTLGGATKRVFTPNLSAQRVKNKPVETNSNPPKKDEKGKKKGQRGRGTDRGRGRGRGKPEWIQLQGTVFGDGPTVGGQKKAPHVHYERGSSTVVPSLKSRKSSLGCVKEENNIQDDDEVLKDLFRDDFIDDLGGDDKNMEPVGLPLFNCDAKLSTDEKGFSKMEKTKIKPNSKAAEFVDINDSKVRIKRDPDAMEVDGIDAAGDAKIKTADLAGKEDISAAEVFGDANLSESGTLLLLQFPDVLPGIAASDDDDKKADVAKKKGATSTVTRQPANEGGSKAGRTLGDFPEGFIGKLQVLKSGKTRLLLGSVPFTVDSGTPAGFLQDVVSIKAKEDNSNDLIVLGHVEHKLVCLPDIDSLIISKDNT